MRGSFARVGSFAGSVLAAIVASSCCIGPLVFALLGLSGAGALVALEPYRPLFTVVSIVSLGIGFYLTKQAPVDDCGCAQPTTQRAGVRLLWAATGLVGLSLFFPFLPPFRQAPSAPMVAAATTTQQYTVKGMTCAACGVTIRAAAQKLPGVGAVEVDADAGEATVHFDPARATAEAIAQAITATGYEAQLRSPRSH